MFALSDDADAALELLALPPLTLPRPVRRANCLARRSCSLRMRLVTSSSSPSFLKPQSLLRHEPAFGVERGRLAHAEFYVSFRVVVAVEIVDGGDWSDGFFLPG